MRVIDKLGQIKTAIGDIGHAIQDESTPLAQEPNLNFVGPGVAATDDSGNTATVVTIGLGTVFMTKNEPDEDITIPSGYTAFWPNLDTSSASVTVNGTLIV